MEKTLHETKQEKKIRLFNEHDGDVMMLLNRMESLGDAILHVLHKNYQMGNRNIEKKVLKTLVNRAGANTAGIRKIRTAIYILRNQEAGIVSRGGVGGGYRKATCWADINKCTEDLFHSQAMSLLGTEKAMKAGARKTYGIEQIKMFVAKDGTKGGFTRVSDSIEGDFDWMEDEPDQKFDPLKERVDDLPTRSEIIFDGDLKICPKCKRQLRFCECF